MMSELTFIEVQVNAEGDILHFKEPTLFEYDMTANEATLCRALLEHDHILVADNVPRLPYMRELAALCRKDISVIHVTAYSERHKQRLCCDTPISKGLLEHIHMEEVLFACTDMILTSIALVDEEVPFFREDL